MSTPPSDAVSTLPVEVVDDVAIRLAGQAQDGIQALGQFLARMAGRTGQGVITFMTIPATVGAGESVFQVRIGAGEVLTVGDRVDLLVAFYQDSYAGQIGHLKPGGLLLYDSDEVVLDPVPEAYRCVGLPLEKLATQAMGGSGKGKNIYVLGLLAQLYQLDTESLHRLLEERFGKKQAEVWQKVEAAFQAGLRFDWSAHLPVRYALGRPSAERAAGSRVVMDGNQAISYGLIAAGVRWGAGYPITPATTVMEILRAELPRYGGNFLQTEDELAAISAAIGMSYGGQLAVTSTSGPGMSLKLEALGFATMAEIPLLVVNVQRGGPSTGIPTQVEQSDLLQALWGSHGDCPRPVLAARDVGDCFDVCREAARLAREYSTPVVILSDQILATRVQAFPMPDLSAMEEPVLDLSPRPAGFKPYAFDQPTRHAPPGTRMEGGSYPTVTGLEHNETGAPTPNAQVHQKMTLRRREKIRRLQESLPAPEIFGAPAGELLLIGWGSTFGPLREATQRLLAAGRKVGHCHLRHIHPLPPALGGILGGYRRVLTVEMNDAGLYGVGQLAYHLRAALGHPALGSLCKTDGLTFQVREILDALEAPAPAV